MSGSESGAGTGTVQSSATGSLSHLPWSMIPSFKPGETDINEYAKKLEFLAGLWPQEHLGQLSSRAAMLCEGSAFKKVMRIDPSKLKVNSDSGVKALVQTLGGIWGRSNLEEKFERFERAIFTTVQRSDESHESYMARHDYQFEELLQMGVGFAEIRAYVLLRNSGLGAEDKKKLIVDADGSLEYKNIVSALKLLGSRFFHELQSGNKTLVRSKTYDVNAVFEDEQPVLATEDEYAYFGEFWDESEPCYDENDPDAVVCMQFEEGLMEALQSDTELASCYNTYMEARKRLTDRNKNRGFWNSSSKGFSSQTKGKSKGKGKWNVRFRKPLSQRILESECRRCGQKGHWKAECPLNRPNNAPSTASNRDSSAFAGATSVLSSTLPEDDMILVAEADEVRVAENGDLVDRLQAVTNQKKQEEYMTKSYDELSKMTIAFGEAKVGMTYMEVIEKDPKYAQWFARKYASSTKETHRSFLYFLNLYVERQELVQGDQTSVVAHPKLELRAKSKSKPSCPIDLESQDSWSEPDMTWEAQHNAQITEEVQSQGQRINHIEDSLAQISQQLQVLLQMTTLSASSK
eukprot:s1525_g11.t1